MVDKFLDFKDIKLAEITGKKPLKLENVTKKNIAVIGLSARIASAENITEFWEGLKNGKDFIRNFPEGRKKDINIFSKTIGRTNMGINDECGYVQGGFLETIDEFDYSLFGISPKEAALMDPSQRIFLQAAWAAVEDAGYGGKRLQGSRTGVYVGHSSDFGEEYKRFVQMVAPSSVGLSIPGNIKSIIGSRISYLLDLKGPSMMVDTACSSSLVAIHLACQGIRNGECDLAIAGGVKVNLFPVKMEKTQDGIGIESSDDRAKTFDDSSDGTGMGEGVGAVLLKPLSKALEDGDHIYAVIKGSAINQDGRTMGITAPNSSAQEDVILRAWKDSGVDPETIDYIEAHGTGTKLGDPIEISGVQRAFKNYTEKKQFCAIGSVKTNIGHLDNAAGMSAFVKVIMALKNKQIPPSLHFIRPNRKINFEDSPVYVNDRLTEWKSNDGPRRCGVSSFGLSGTNCHLVLEEAPEQESSNIHSTDENNTFHILALSAKSREALLELLNEYKEFIKNNEGIDLENICYTANIGRGHYNCRLAIISGDTAELGDKIETLCKSKLDVIENENVFYGEHKAVIATKQLRNAGEISEEEKRQASTEAEKKVKEIKLLRKGAYRVLLDDICKLYINGAEINWEEFYRGRNKRKISIPVYPFERKKCWIEPETSDISGNENGKNPLHPLIDTCLTDAMGIKVYSTHFSIWRHWELREHKVFDNYVMPGTTYLEIAREIGKRYFLKNSIELRDIVFLSPLIVDEREVKEVQTIVKEESGFLEFNIVSLDEKNRSWVKHAEGKVYDMGEDSNPWCSLEEIKGRLEMIEKMQYEEKGDLETGVQVGPRFFNLRKAFIGTDEMLAYLELSSEFHTDLHKYVLHPALMDSAVNMANPSLGQGVYLPLLYKNIRIYGPTPGRFYSYMKKKNKYKESNESGTFNITLADENGNVFSEIEGYTVKRVHEPDIRPSGSSDGTVGYYRITWTPNEINTKKLYRNNGVILVFKKEKGIGADIVHQLERNGVEVIEIEPGEKYEQINEKRYRVGATQEDYVNLIKEFKGKQLSQIIHLLTASEDETDFYKKQELGLNSLFYLTRALINCKISTNTDLYLVSMLANKVRGNEKNIDPLNAAMFGLGKVVTQEYPHLICRSIDIDENTTANDIIHELEGDGDIRQTAYRDGVRYIQEFEEIDDIRVKEVELKDEGVYVITGGAGGIGIEIGKYLAGKARINLALIGRSSPSTSDECDSVLENSENTKICNVINAIKSVSIAGGNVEYYQADVSKEDEIKKVLDGLRERYGRINGIIHCAGIAGNGFIIRKDESEFKKVIGPKIQGTWLLDKLTREEDPDFFIMFSSVTAILGGAGQGDYTAANAYMDSYAAYRNMQGKRTLTINWPPWSEVGMAFDYGALKNDSLFKPVKTIEGMKIFDKIFNSGLENVIPGKLDLAILGNASENLPVKLSNSIKTAAKKQVGKQSQEVSRPVGEEKKLHDVLLRGKSKGDYSDLEYKIAGMWSNVLGFKEVDIYDNFNDMGGDSILATRLLKEMEKEFAGLVDISDIFTYSTIAEMAQYITAEKEREKRENNQGIETGSSDIEDVLMQLAKGEITISDANRLVKLGDDE